MSSAICSMHRGFASGGQVSTIPASQITTESWNATPLDMGRIGKSYDFAGSVGTQNIFTHPLAFTHDGGEVVFNLPNGLQGYYLANASGFRLDEAPINIVSNPAASDPTVRNGLSCMGCPHGGDENL